MENPEARPLRSAPWLFGPQGMGVLLLVMLVSASLSAIHVALLAAGLLAVGAIGWAWSRLALRRVAYGRAAQTLRAFCGEGVVLESDLANRKVVPLPWVEVWERVPLALRAAVETERSLSEPTTGWICQGGSLWPYQRARWRLPVHCVRRGAYQIKDARIRAGDPFGLFEQEGVAKQHVEVLVYPRVVPLQRLSLPFQHPALDLAGPRSLVVDPTRTAALRDYRPGDPQRLIHWPSTAHRGSLQVRVLEPTTSLHVGLVLDMRGFQHSWGGYRHTLLELALSALASIALYLHGQDRPVGFWVNAQPAAAVPPGASAGHLQALLDAMARLEPVASGPLVPWALAHLPAGSTIVLAASDAALDLSEDVARLEAAGHRAVVLLATQTDIPSLTHAANVVRLRPDQDLAATLEGRL